MTQARWGNGYLPHEWIDIDIRCVADIDQLRPWLAHLGISVTRLGDSMEGWEVRGGGPTYWTLRDASHVLAQSEGWQEPTRRRFLSEACAAAEAGELVVIDPSTLLTYRPARVSDFWDYVTSVEINDWLSLRRASYHWPKWAALSGQLIPPPTSFAATTTATVKAGIGPGISTDDLCDGFDGLKFSSLQWRQKIADGPRGWLLECRVSRGGGGNTPTQATWWAVNVAIALLEGRPRGEAVKRSEIDHAFNVRPKLAPCRKAWFDYCADHPHLG